MMILRCSLLFAAALTLSNCCLSTSGCNGPVALNAAPAPAAMAPVAAAPAAWDGLNEQPAMEDDAAVDVTQRKKPGRRSRAANIDDMSSQSSRSRDDLSWEDQQEADRAADARLRQKLIICRDCSASR
jgi:hypothetical protein